VELFFKWIKQHLRIKRFLRHLRKRRKSQVWIAWHLWLVCHRQKAAESRSVVACDATNLERDAFRESPLFSFLPTSHLTEKLAVPGNQLILVMNVSDTTGVVCSVNPRRHMRTTVRDRCKFTNSGPEARQPAATSTHECQNSWEHLWIRFSD